MDNIKTDEIITEFLNQYLLIIETRIEKDFYKLKVFDGKLDKKYNQEEPVLLFIVENNYFSNYRATYKKIYNNLDNIPKNQREVFIKLTKKYKEIRKEN